MSEHAWYFPVLNMDKSIFLYVDLKVYLSEIKRDRISNITEKFQFSRDCFDKDGLRFNHVENELRRYTSGRISRSFEFV